LGITNLHVAIEEYREGVPFSLGLVEHRHAENGILASRHTCLRLEKAVEVNSLFASRADSRKAII
jgi:hypothetical protein